MGHLMMDLKSNAKIVAIAQRHSSLRLNAPPRRMPSAVGKGTFFFIFYYY